MDEPIIELKNVPFAAQNETIIRDISLKFRTAAATALIGPSGGGKSTVLKLAAGLLVPSGGAVFFQGRNISALNKAQNLAFRREGAVVFQDSALWANQDIHEILELPLRIHFPRMSRDERDRRITELAALVGYARALRFRPERLSMGEQKLIAFARAMACNPSLLFLDEWTESLDEGAARRLIGIVRRMKEAGNTIIFVSHDLPLIKSLADYVIMIREGSVVRELTGEQISGDAGLANMVEKEINPCDLEYDLPTE